VRRRRAEVRRRRGVHRLLERRPRVRGLFSQEHFTIWNLTAAGAVLLFLPTALIFLASQRFFVRGITLTGMK
jgi:ABC-type glycerol-3-phosphate transport system permease component